MEQYTWDDPRQIRQEYEAGREFKNGLGTRGLYEQSRVNERFYSGDQWHGVSSAADRPLVRQNIIKRIGDYKMAAISSSPLTVNYAADGIPNTLDMQQQIQREKASLRSGTARAEETAAVLSADEELQLVMSSLSDYFRATAERVRLERLKEEALRNAYTSGTGLIYTYWDPSVRTGLYADAAHRAPITGDIRCEVLDVENVYFGDPNTENLQEQPYLLIAQRRRIADIRREMLRNGVRSGAEALTADRQDTALLPGDDDREEPENSGKATVITKLYKEWDRQGRSCRIMGTQVCGDVVVRPPFCLGIRMYPLAEFRWDRRKGCAYGESEITHLIANQIAINRMLSASVWGVMMTGLPIMVVNGDVVTQPVTNDPGQILKVYGTAEEVERAVRYIQPPTLSPQFDQSIAMLIGDTMEHAGANDAALGNMRPDNSAAIIALREAAGLPLQPMQNRFYGFIEELARIWAEFWVMLYGKRSLKIEDEGGIWYLPFDGERYRELLISVRVDVGSSSLWSEAQSTQTLDNLFARNVIDAVQYLQRLPKGTVPNVSGLIRELNERAEQLGDALPAENGREALLSLLPDGERQQFEALSAEEQQALLTQLTV